METNDAVFLAAHDTGSRKIAFYDMGVLLIDLDLLRIVMDEARMIRMIGQGMPIQVIFHRLFGCLTKTIPDEIWNYRADRYTSYCSRSDMVPGELWEMRHTAILHFAGRSKPWHPHYHYRFGSLYLHYQILAERTAMI